GRPVGHRKQHTRRLCAPPAGQGGGGGPRPPHPDRTRCRVFPPAGGLMTSLSIRSRLTLWYALVLLAGFSVFGFGMWLALEQRMIAGIDARLAQRLQGVKNSLGAAAGIGSRDQLQQELT